MASKQNESFEAVSNVMPQTTPAITEYLPSLKHISIGFERCCHTNTHSVIAELLIMNEFPYKCSQKSRKQTVNKTYLNVPSGKEVYASSKASKTS